MTPWSIESVEAVSRGCSPWDPQSIAPRRCPDQGACHHECEGGCFRVKFCAPLHPLSGWPEDGSWPAGCVEVHGMPSKYVW